MSNVCKICALLLFPITGMPTHSVKNSVMRNQCVSAGVKFSPDHGYGYRADYVLAFSTAQVNRSFQFTGWYSRKVIKGEVARLTTAVPASENLADRAEYKNYPRVLRLMLDDNASVRVDAHSRLTYLGFHCLSVTGTSHYDHQLYHVQTWFIHPEGYNYGFPLREYVTGPGGEYALVEAVRVQHEK